MDTRLHHRGAERVLLQMLSESPVVLVTGPRQSGKSTLVRDLIADRFSARYLTLDDTALLDAATRDPQGFITALGSASVIIDEVQLAPGLFRAIKMSVDADRRPGRFLLTGSADPAVSPQVSEALTGRMRSITLWPLEQGEIADAPGEFVNTVFSNELSFAAGTGAIDRRDLIGRVIAGGYPELLSLPEGPARQRWAEDYLLRVVERDVPRLSEIADRLAMPRLLRLLAARSMQLLNLSEVSRLAEIKRATLDRYTALLEATYLVRLIPAWAGDPAREHSKRPKPVVTDSGLACHLLGADETRLLRDPDLLGPLLEAFVACELMRQESFSESRVRMAHFRSGSAEVDLVLEDAAGRLVGVDVKATASPTAADFRGLRAFAERTGPSFVRGVLLHTGTASVPFGDGLWALPVSTLW
jgi:hypothetical protein